MATAMLTIKLECQGKSALHLLRMVSSYLMQDTSTVVFCVGWDRYQFGLVVLCPGSLLRVSVVLLDESHFILLSRDVSQSLLTVP